METSLWLMATATRESTASHPMAHCYSPGEKSAPQLGSFAFPTRSLLRQMSVCLLLTERMVGFRCSHWMENYSRFGMMCNGPSVSHSIRKVGSTWARHPTVRHTRQWLTGGPKAGLPGSAFLTKKAGYWKALKGALQGTVAQVTLCRWKAWQSTRKGTFTSTSLHGFVCVLFWVGLVPLSVLFGDVFRAFNPWRAIGRAVAGSPRPVRAARFPRRSTRRLGRWPAALRDLPVRDMELVYGDSGEPDNRVAIAVLAYSALTFVAMALYGVEPWIDRGEAFSVYFNLFSRLSPFETRDGEVGLRRAALRAAPAAQPAPGRWRCSPVMIGARSRFDGFPPKRRPWNSLAPHMPELLPAIAACRPAGHAFNLDLHGRSDRRRCSSSAGFYRLGYRSARRTVGGGFSARRLANEFVHSLVPIALAYVAAHYFTLLLFQGQGIAYLISDPLCPSPTSSSPRWATPRSTTP